MTNLSKKEENRLFNNPKIEREEPNVETPSKDYHKSEGKQLSPSVEEDIKKFSEDIEFLEGGFKEVSDRYEKLVNIMIHRATLLNVKIDLKTEDVSEPTLKALSVLSLGGSTEVSFEDYVELLRIEQSAASNYIASTIDVENILSGQSEAQKNNIAQNFAQNPTIDAISVIKNEFKQKIIKTNYPQLLSTELYVKRIFEANSSISAIKEMNTLPDKTKVSESKETPRSKKRENKINMYVKECFPCEARTMGLIEDFKISASMKNFLKTFYSKLFANIRGLMADELGTIGYTFSIDICRIINIFGNSVCLPDINAVLLLLKTTYKRLLNLTVGRFEQIAVNLPTGAIQSFLDAGIDAILMLITKLLNTIFSPLDCIIRSLGRELSKTPIDQTSLAKSHDNLKDSFTDVWSDLYKTIIEGKEDLDGMVESIVSQLNKKIKSEIGISEENRVLFGRLEKTTSYLSLIQEILLVKKNYDSIYGDDFWNKMAKSICAAAYGNKFPWLHVEDVIDIYDEDDDEDEDDNDDIDDEGGDDDDDDDDNDDEDDEDGNDDLIDIIDDSPISDLVDKPKVTQILNTKKAKEYRKLIETDGEYLGPSKKSIDEYDKTMNALNSKNKAIKRSRKLKEGQRNSLPVLRISFRRCMESGSLDTFTASEVQEWIKIVNQVTGYNK